MRASRGEAYSALVVEGPLRRGFRSFLRRPRKRTYRPIEASKIVVCYVRNDTRRSPASLCGHGEAIPASSPRQAVSFSSPPKAQRPRKAFKPGQLNNPGGKVLDPEARKALMEILRCRAAAGSIGFPAE
jgi:hypothetical protein